jgi:hypothetical protein
MPNEVNRRDFILRSAGPASVALSRLPAADAAPIADPDDLAKLTIAEASKKIRSGEITCANLTRACIESSRTYNPKINAYITLMQVPLRSFCGSNSDRCKWLVLESG